VSAIGQYYCVHECVIEFVHTISYKLLAAILSNLQLGALGDKGEPITF